MASPRPKDTVTLIVALLLVLIGNHEKKLTA
jgi:hypothetical protein